MRGAGRLCSGVQKMNEMLENKDTMELFDPLTKQGPLISKQRIRPGHLQ
jgi:hypothetical protein